MTQIWVIPPFDYEIPDGWQQVWENNLRHGFISVGWSGLRNVSRLSEAEIVERHQKTFPDAKKRGSMADAKVLYKFWHMLSVGDMVVARRGRKSIAGIGTIIGAPYYDPKKAKDAFPTGYNYPNHIDVDWSDEHRDVMFSKQVFGMQTITSIDQSKLEGLLGSAVSAGEYYPDEVEPREYTEGAVKQTVVNAYERDPKARAACLKHHGYRCSVCEMLFAEVYGKIGIGFIHVHHLKPISTRKETYRVDPIKDLAPVCPNCHAMLHTKKPPFSISELRKHLA